MNYSSFYLSLLLIFQLIASSSTLPKVPVDPFDSDKNDDNEDDDDSSGLPFDTIVTRAPSTIQERQQAIQEQALENLNRPPPVQPRRRKVRPGTRRRGGYYKPAIGGALYNIYPLFYPKGPDYCPHLRGVFRFTCQPSKPLRLDLVEFCKQYAAFCGVINTHRLPGPGTGPASGPNGVGHIGVSGNFGFGIGAVPGLEVNAGWGVDVGPLPGVGESVDVGINYNIGLLGASPPLKYRRGMDSPRDSRSGLVGLGGGVGVNPGGGVGPIGVSDGLGIG